MAEFHQVEGVVADYDITLGNLLGEQLIECFVSNDSRSCAAFMQEFFEKTGNKKLRFKPAYNPYTEVGP